MEYKYTNTAFYKCKKYDNTRRVQFTSQTVHKTQKAMILSLILYCCKCIQRLLL